MEQCLESLVISMANENNKDYVWVLSTNSGSASYCRTETFDDVAAVKRRLHSYRGRIADLRCIHVDEMVRISPDDLMKDNKTWRERGQEGDYNKIVNDLVKGKVNGNPH